MSKVRNLRHNQYKNWVIPSDFQDSSYPAESALVTRLRGGTFEYFVPYPFSYSEDAAYNYCLAFLVESIELLPLKVDLAFDSVWRAFESFYKDQVNAGRGLNLPDEAQALAVRLDNQSEHNANLDRLLSIIPAQSCEYLAKRIFQHWQSTQWNEQRLWNRLASPPGHRPAVADFLTRVAKKYNAPTFADGDRRKAAMLIRLALSGAQVQVEGATILLPRSERISFLINALLYTYRNDRFHGNMQPPFKSSISTLKTYAHAHYCFLWAHFLFLFLTTIGPPVLAQHRLIAANISHNIGAFSNLYGSHIQR